MTDHILSGKLKGEQVDLILTQKGVLMRVGDAKHGPRPVIDALTMVRPGEWTVGLGSLRGTFIPDSSEEMSRAVSKHLVDVKPGLSHLAQSMFDMAPTIKQGFESNDRLLDMIEIIWRMGGESPPDFGDQRRRFEVMKTRHEEFLELMAPRGWAFSRTVQEEGFYVVLHAALKHQAGTEHLVDDDLAKRIAHHKGVPRLVAEIAESDFESIWSWSFVAGEAAAALTRGSPTAAFAWLVIAEGMWSDFGEVVSRSRATPYRSAKRQTPLTERLTFSRESLFVALETLARSVPRNYTEPVEHAPTSRHGLLHGRVRGSLNLSHAAKAFTVVEAIIEQARAAEHLFPEEMIEPPPWRP